MVTLLQLRRIMTAIWNQFLTGLPFLSINRFGFQACKPRCLFTWKKLLTINIIVTTEHHLTSPLQHPTETNQHSPKG